MLTITHAMAGAAIASVIPNPAISLPLAFGSHFVMDRAPHWPDDDTKKKLAKRIYIIVLIDVFVAIIGTLFLARTTSNNLIVWGALSGSIMDIDAMFYHGKFVDIFKTPLPKPLSRLHGGVQNETGSIWGIVIQLAIIVLSVYLVLNCA